jgi:26S proteasome regulatory subunit N2
MPGLVTATGVLGFLSDEEPELKVFALQTLNDDIDTVWTEVAGALSQMCVVPPPSLLSLLLWRRLTPS